MSEAFQSQQAVDAWREILGPAKVIADPESVSRETASACGSERQVVAVLKPTTQEEIVRLIEVANRFRVPLYPISCGKQWGLGSKLPVKDGAAVVDLSGMSRILEISAKHAYAVVEPGVTQRQLLDEIRRRDLPLMLNVTGSSAGTSLIGNALDRGVGYFASRAHGISNMHVVLGSGNVIQTGFGHFEGATTKNLYKAGVGPSLDGLFLQGNFGIVTSACIDLIPKPEAHMAVILKIEDEERLPQLIDRLVRLRKEGIIQTVAHVGNRERSYITLAPLLYEQLLASGEPEGDETRREAVRMLEEGGFGPWSAALGLLGTNGQIRLACREIRRAFRGVARLMFLNDRKMALARAVAERLSGNPYMRRQLMMLRAVEPVYGFTRGDATDKSLQGVYWPVGDFEHLDSTEPDQTNSGVLFCLPIFPADGNGVMEAVRVTREVFRSHGFEVAITVNLMDERAMEGVVSLAFDRRDAGLQKQAHACIQEMEARYMEMGFPPYRVGINSMHHVVREDDSFWQVSAEIKKALDPNGIIAPGRYSLL